MSFKGKERELKRADPSTIHNKFLVGYQGWFTCPGDGSSSDEREWQHWLRRGTLATDLWPDTSAYSSDELYSVPGFHHANGDAACLFSSRHPKTVRRHFNYMAQHGIDGAFLSRFVGQCDSELSSPHQLQFRDEVGRNVEQAAELEGRVFAIMYDVTGAPPERIHSIIEKDWTHLIDEERILDSPSYLRERSKPVVGLFGFGFARARHTPQLVRAVISTIRKAVPEGVYIVAGVPTHWRTGVEDASSDPSFVELWLNDVDAIMPWTIGRYRNGDQANDYSTNIIEQDLALLQKRAESEKHAAIDFIPVVLPGASGHNMSRGRWCFNDVKRDGGHFLWRQIFNVCSQGVNIVYGATWDEFDEGTALMPAVMDRRELPINRSLKQPPLLLTEEVYDVSKDWYMRICGLAADVLHKEAILKENFPYEALISYWAKHPKCESPNFDVTPGEGTLTPRPASTAPSNVSEEVEPTPPPYTRSPDHTSPRNVPGNNPSPKRLSLKRPTPQGPSRINSPAKTPPQSTPSPRPLPAIPVTPAELSETSDSSSGSGAMDAQPSLQVTRASNLLNQESTIYTRASLVPSIMLADHPSPSPTPEQGRGGSQVSSVDPADGSSSPSPSASSTMTMAASIGSMGAPSPSSTTSEESFISRSLSMSKKNKRNKRLSEMISLSWNKKNGDSESSSSVGAESKSFRGRRSDEI